MKIVNSRSPEIHGEYYPHIDGIRALAVIPVVLFHVLAVLCPGGFAGVDVFFVISGYLITGGILRDLQKERFSVRNFYHRRIKRIMPAYFALILGVFTAGCVLYHAQPLIFLGDAVAAGTLFFANVHFLLLGGDYFGPELHSQALLHLWSLSVEEQFYLFIPVICAVIWRLRRNWLLPVFVGIALLSFAGAIHAIAIGKQSHAFYILRFRAWELLAGSVLAMLPPALPAKLAPPSLGLFHVSCLSYLSRFPAFLGLLMVLLPYALLSSKTPFPGLAALSSVLGTALLIRYGGGGWVSRVLAWRPFVFTGKISYSLYLWHWPVTVFWRYAVCEQLYAYDYVGMFLLSFVLAYLSWKFIELPVRTAQAWTPKRTFAFAAAGIALLVTLGTVCVSFKGWPKTLHPEANTVAPPPEPRDPFIMARALALTRQAVALVGQENRFITKHDQRLKALKKSHRAEGGRDDQGPIGLCTAAPVVFILGDSHAGSLRYGLDFLLNEKGIPGYLVSLSNTDFFNLGIQEAQQAINLMSTMTEVKQVLLVERWVRALAAGDRHISTTQEQREASWRQIESFAQQVRGMGKQLFIATDIPLYQNAYRELLIRSKLIYLRDAGLLDSAMRQSKDEYEATQGEICRRLRCLCQETGAVLVPLHLAFLRDGYYIAAYQQDGKEFVLYRNQDHLSRAGSLFAAQFIIPYLFPDGFSKPVEPQPLP